MEHSEYSISNPPGKTEELIVALKGVRDELRESDTV